MKTNMTASSALIMASIFSALGDERKAAHYEAAALRTRFPRVARYDALAASVGCELAAREAARGAL